MTTPTMAESPETRYVAARSTALLLDTDDPTRVLAWLCPLCKLWTRPRRFSITSGTCRTCTPAPNTSPGRAVARHA